MTEKKIFTTPKIRKFARELGADLTKITGSQRKGRIVEEDVKKYIKKNLSTNNFTKKKIETLVEEYKHEEFGDIEVKDIPRVKKIALLHLSKSWSNIPHVTHHDESPRKSLRIDPTEINLPTTSRVGSSAMFSLEGSQNDDENKLSPST